MKHLLFRVFGKIRNGIDTLTRIAPGAKVVPTYKMLAFLG